MWKKRDTSPIPVSRTPEEKERLRRERIAELANERAELQRQCDELRGFFAYSESRPLKARIMEIDIILASLESMEVK